MNKKNKHYQQLRQKPISQICFLRKTGMKTRAIAAEGGMPFSTVSRELRKNSVDCGNKQDYRGQERPGQ